MRQAYDYWQDQPGSLRSAHGRKNREQTHKHQTHAHDAGGETRLKAPSNHPRVEAKRRLAGGAFSLETREFNRKHEDHSPTTPGDVLANSTRQDVSRTTRTRTRNEAHPSPSGRTSVHSRHRRSAAEAHQHLRRNSIKYILTLAGRAHPNKPRAIRGATAHRNCGRKSDPATPFSRKVARTLPRAAHEGSHRKLPRG